MMRLCERCGFVPGVIPLLKCSKIVLCHECRSHIISDLGKDNAEVMLSKYSEIKKLEFDAKLRLIQLNIPFETIIINTPKV